MKAPGEYIKEEIASRGWTQTQLAEILGRPVQTINGIIGGKKAITPDTAAALGVALGPDAVTWLNREAEYRLATLNSDTSEVERKVRLFELAPVRDMEKRGWIKPSKNVGDLEKELCRFFGVASLDQRLDEAFSPRTGTTVSEHLSPSQRAWCHRAKQLAGSLIVNSYDSSKSGVLVKRLRRLAAYRNEADKVADVLSELGVRFVVVEPIPGAKIDGAAFWMDGEPVVATSLRYDRHDYFWFTLMHEIMHIVHGDGFSVDDDLGREENHAPSVLKDDAERRADEAASAALVPVKELESFIRRVGPLYSRQRVIQFAHTIKMHPGVIVGQLQNRGEIGWHALRDTLVKVRDLVTQTALTDGWGNIVGHELD